MRSLYQEKEIKKGKMIAIQKKKLASFERIKFESWGTN